MSSNTSLLITGGNTGVGLEIFQHFKPHSKSLSFSSGHDIRDPEIRKQIAEMSLQYDIFFNHAYCLDRSQALLLDEVYQLWRKNNKAGHIFTTGTYGTYAAGGIDPQYITLKSELDELHKEFIQQIKYEKLKFNMTLLRLGMLDTERSRKKPHWPGYGLQGKDIVKLIEFIYGLPKNLLVDDIVFESKAELV
ncbi:MAG: hypothetical protein ACXWQQ_12570 [Pseudobdellovibrio sp.]